MQNMENLVNNYPKEAIQQSGKIKICVCQENGRKHILYNQSNVFLTKIKVDGALIKSGERCDYAVDAEAKDIFLIELKGSDISHACSQILATFYYFINNYQSERWHARIIVSKVRAPNIISSEEKRLQKLQKERSDFDYVIKTGEFRESI